MRESRMFLCSHCDFKTNFDANDCEDRKRAWAEATAHENLCDHNPLVKRLFELEEEKTSLQCMVDEWIPEVYPTVIGDCQEANEKLEMISAMEQISRECHKQIAISSGPSRCIGYRAIDKMVKRFITA